MCFGSFLTIVKCWAGKSWQYARSFLSQIVLSDLASLCSKFVLKIYISRQSSQHFQQIFSSNIVHFLPTCPIQRILLSNFQVIYSLNFIFTTIQLMSQFQDFSTTPIFPHTSQKCIKYWYLPRGYRNYSLSDIYSPHEIM